jgi:hypothetical protein
MASAAKSFGIGYDWVGIAGDALAACHMEDLSVLINPPRQWPSNHNVLPGHVVCARLDIAEMTARPTTAHRLILAIDTAPESGAN